MINVRRWSGPCRTTSTPSGVKTVSGSTSAICGARGGSLSVDEHAFGGVSNPAVKGQVDLDPSFVLKQDAVHLREVLVCANHVTGGRRAKRTRGRECVDGLED